MGWNQIKRNPNDILFSNYIREKAKWRCEKCGKVCKIGKERIAQLEASHYVGRGKWSVRYDIENVYALCSNCHKRMGGYTRDENGEYDLWVKEKLGEKGYRNLIIRANTPNPQMKDKILVKMLIQRLTTELNGQPHT
jgi:hypothetical protein